MNRSVSEYRLGAEDVMERKRFIVEIGTGIDLHGEDVTKAACRAVSDAISKSCLCGLIEIHHLNDFSNMHVEVLVASPYPDHIDLEQVTAVIPLGTKSARAVAGGMIADGLCVEQFAPGTGRIVVVNAAVTVYVDI